jgi:hypothetical protein
MASITPATNRNCFLGGPWVAISDLRVDSRRAPARWAGRGKWPGLWPLVGLQNRVAHSQGINAVARRISRRAPAAGAGGLDFNDVARGDRALGFRW